MKKQKEPIHLENIQGTIQPKNFPILPTDWTTEWDTFLSSDQKHQIYTVTHHIQAWTKEALETNPKMGRVLVVAHGLGEHSGRYLHFPHYLKDTVGAIHLIDHVGHGRSEGLRGHVHHFDQFADDLILAIARLEKKLISQFGYAEIHLLGHSMGGLVVLRALLKNPKLNLSSVSLSAPLLAPYRKVPALKRAGGYILSKFWSSFHLPSGLDPNHVSHDPAVVQAYLSDRLVHDKVTPKFFFSLENTLADTLAKNTGFSYPLLLLLPGKDLLVNSEVALKYFQQLKIRDKSLKNYPNFYHESFNEPGKEIIFNDLKAWIDGHSTHLSEIPSDQFISQ